MSGPLSQCPLWDYQKAFYQSQGVDAWVNQVPFYATSNAFIAQAYAEVIAKFIYENPHVDPYRIIECGAGSGQFAALFLSALQRECELLDIPNSQWRYVMTDFHQSVIDYWLSHKAFQPWVSAQQLDFACFDVGSDRQLSLQMSGDTISTQSIETPIIFFANYLFDSLPCDVYSISNGEVRPVSVELDCNEAQIKDGVVTDVDQLSVKFSTQESVIEQANGLLRYYAEQLIDSKVIVPVAAMDLLQLMSGWSKVGLLCICSDKGYVSIDELDHLDWPELTSHGHCFSMMTNFDALAYQAHEANGAAYLMGPRAGFKTAVLTYGLTLAENPLTKASIAQRFWGFSPNDYIHAHRHMQATLAHYNLEACASHLALSQCDPTAFQYLYPRIYEQLDGADMQTVDYLALLLERVADNFYFIPKLQDALFNIAVFFHTLKRYRQALSFYQQSSQYYPQVFGLYFNMGVCAFHLGENAHAIEYFHQAQALDPNDENTKTWLDRLG